MPLGRKRVGFRTLAGGAHATDHAKPRHPAAGSAVGKSVFLEETGERLGTVLETLVDAQHQLTGYKVKDDSSGTVLSFPHDQFEARSDGLVLVPGWYVSGLKTVDVLEFKDRITPELRVLLTDRTVTIEEAYRIFVQHDDALAHHIDESRILLGQVTQRLEALEKERKGLKEALLDLTEQRLINDIDRRTFSGLVLEHRRKAAVIDFNIKKCTDLLDRLGKTSVGMLSCALLATERSRQEPNAASETSVDDGSYKERYEELQGRYARLQEGYDDLKAAVEKLLARTNL